MSTHTRAPDFLLSVIVPCFNEEEIILATYHRLCEVLGTQQFRLQLIFVDDGSEDGTTTILQQLSASDFKVKFIALVRNFGHQSAVSAGVAHADGDAAVIIDADLQDPPEVILAMIDKWREGFDVVYGIRTKRKEAMWKRFCYAAFYRVLNNLASIDTPLDAGDFSLIDQQVLAQIRRLPEKNRFFRGLRAWVGFRQIGIPYERQQRAAEAPNTHFAELAKLASDGIFNFSTVPLTIVFFLGLTMSLISLIAFVAILFLRIFDVPVFGLHIKNVQGFASTILSILLIGGVQLLSFGVLGEYVGRIYQEVKARPPYIIREIAVVFFRRSVGKPYISAIKKCGSKQRSQPLS